MKAYYNEHDPKAAAWLRELIKDGHIAPGDVDERSITEVSPSDLTPYAQCHFFAGIGGWSYALRLAGIPDSFPVWTGSCPCQPFSGAGKKKGTKDERHLWPSFARLIDAKQPAIVFGEQVASADGRVWLDGVFADLEDMGYRPAGADLCAAGVGAPHPRQRLYWMGYSNRSGSQPGRQTATPNGYGGAALADGCARGLEFATSKRRGGARIQDGRQSEASGSGETCRLEHTESDGREQRRTEPERGSVTSGCGASGLEHAEQPGLEGYARDGDHGHKPGRLGTEAPGSVAATGGAWDSFDFLPCLDGKARRVESGTFPLAHGVPGRVGLLRGYGNAIVPQVAAEFVTASFEAIAL